MLIRITALLCFLSVYRIGAAEDSTSYYFVYLKDKPASEYNIEQPGTFLSAKAIERRKKRKSTIDQSDLPVSGEYLQKVASIQGVTVINRSKWLNAVEIKTNGDRHLIEQLKAFHFVLKIEFLGRIKDRIKPLIEPPLDEDYKKARKLAEDKRDNTFKQLSKEDYGKSWQHNRQIGIDGLHRNNLGDNIHIAIFDAGFFNAYKVKGMEDLLLPDVIIRDFVDYDNSVWEDDRHGANVLGFMKTWNPGTYIGSAPMARYSLMRTENPTSEFPTEEVNWLFAAEFADSLGVDMIVSSLGYHTFDDPALSHTHQQLDGKTSIIAKAANHAYQKGIMVVTSAGNEGSGKWHKIGTPSDAPGVLGIGACDEHGFYVSFSSVGPSADKRVKPDFLTMGYKVSVASPNGVYSGNGTSYSTPIFGGAMACMIRAFPGKSYEEIRWAMRMSATHSSKPDSAYGYGLPDYTLASHILGYFHPTDTFGDLLYNKPEPVFFQDLGIFFRSKSAQTVRVTIKGQRKKKMKNIFHQSYRLKAGEWILESALFDIYKKETRKKRKQHLQFLVLTIETESGTVQKTISLNYD
jgi:serine protease AprX